MCILILPFAEARAATLTIGLRDGASAAVALARWRGGYGAETLPLSAVADLSAKDGADGATVLPDGTCVLARPIGQRPERLGLTVPVFGSCRGRPADVTFASIRGFAEAKGGQVPHPITLGTRFETLKFRTEGLWGEPLWRVWLLSVEQTQGSAPGTAPGGTGPGLPPPAPAPLPPSLSVLAAAIFAIVALGRKPRLFLRRKA
ncbi:MAG: hypothetical protein KDE03_04915 [Rhodobacteraceae bacterium]|nr:hypothetical protein [Paracoccaceae bacterium]